MSDNKVLKSIAKTVKTAAKVSASSTSWLILYQKKTPDILKVEK